LPRLTVLSEQRGQPLSPDVIASVSTPHEEAGGFVAGLWKLPEPMRLAIAEHLATQLGLGLPVFDEDGHADRLTSALKTFSIDAKWLERLVRDGKRIVELALPE
jgi:HD-like signal output (HDOD) protein